MSKIKMNYLKLNFVKNICNVCDETFCCAECRAKHERSTHSFVDECDICVFGKIGMGALSEELLEHVEKHHWPLNCVYCKRVFASVNELQLHSKCPVGPPEEEEEPPILASKTPTRIVDSEKPALKTLTSTPMNFDTNKLLDFFGKNTPLESVACKPSYKQTDLLDNISSTKTNKRRVTFSDTLSTSVPETASNCENKSESVADKLYKCDRGATPPVEEEFTSAKYESSIIEENDNIEVKSTGILKKRRSSTFSEAWQSALDSTYFDQEGGHNTTISVSTSTYSKQLETSRSALIIETDCIPEIGEENCENQESSCFWSNFSSVASLVKNVVQTISKKRQLSESESVLDENFVKVKRIKLTEIKCRPTIRNLFVFKVDKATQTESC